MKRYRRLGSSLARSTDLMTPLDTLIANFLGRQVSRNLV
jgi:hypothetical protein